MNQIQTDADRCMDCIDDLANAILNWSCKSHICPSKSEGRRQGCMSKLLAMHDSCISDFITAITANLWDRNALTPAERLEDIRRTFAPVPGGLQLAFGVSVCDATMQFVTGHTEYAVRKVRRAIESGTVDLSDGRLRSGKLGERGAEAVAFMLKFAQEYGDLSPSDPSVIWLGYLRPTISMYPEYNRFCTDRGVEPITAEWFMCLFRRHYSARGRISMVAIRARPAPEVGHCAQCLKHSAEVRNGTPAERLAARVRQAGHIEVIKYLRRRYSERRLESASVYCHLAKAISARNQAGPKRPVLWGASFSISAGSDATARFSTSMPILPPAFGFLTITGGRIGVKMTNCVLHGAGNAGANSVVHVLTPEYVPYDGNLQRHLLLYVILPKLLKPFIDAGVPPPRSMNFQTDRGPDCNNRESHGIWTYIVENNLFEIVKQSSLPPDHGYDFNPLCQ